MPIDTSTRRVKIVIVGESEVGKTSLSLRFCKGIFQGRTRPTLGIEFYSKIIPLYEKKKQHQRHDDSESDDSDDQRNVMVQVWDTAGEERYSALASTVYRGAHGAIIVYDITNAASFKQVPTWIQQVRANTTDIPVCLVGNKCDLEHLRTVPTAEANRLVHRLQRSEQGQQLFFMETSAGENFHVDAAFTTIIRATAVVDSIPTLKAIAEITTTSGPRRRKVVALSDQNQHDALLSSSNYRGELAGDANNSYSKSKSSCGRCAVL